MTLKTQQEDQKKGDLVFAPSPVTDIDAIGFSLRLQGIQIRDCISCQGSEERPFIFVGTVPSNQTFLEGVLRRGNGVLDIDGARISHKTVNGGNLADNPHLRGTKLRSSPVSTCFGRAGDVTDLTSGTGRFPANLIFQHSEGCRCEGTKKVKGDARIGGEGQREGGFMNVGAAKGSSAPNSALYGNEDGSEEVANWICEPSCPVGILDRQSGILKSGGGVKKSSGTTVYGGTSFNASTTKGTGENFETDEGGASRFFQQVQSEEELEDYLEALIRKGKFE